MKPPLTASQKEQIRRESIWFAVQEASNYGEDYEKAKLVYIAQASKKYKKA